MSQVRIQRRAARLAKVAHVRDALQVEATLTARFAARAHGVGFDVLAADLRAQHTRLAAMGKVLEDAVPRRGLPVDDS